MSELWGYYWTPLVLIHGLCQLYQWIAYVQSTVWMVSTLRTPHQKQSSDFTADTWAVHWSKLCTGQPMGWLNPYFVHKHTCVFHLCAKFGQSRNEITQIIKVWITNGALCHMTAQAECKWISLTSGHQYASNCLSFYYREHTQLDISVATWQPLHKHYQTNFTFKTFTVIPAATTLLSVSFRRC